MKSILGPGIIALLFCIISVNTFSQQLKLGVPAIVIVEEIAEANVYETTDLIGFAGQKSKQLQRLNQLVEIDETELLMDVAFNHQNPVARLYALKAFQIKKAAIPDELKTKFQNDSSKIIVASGCLITSKTVASLAFQILRI